MNKLTELSDAPSSLEEFQNWPPSRIALLTTNKALVFAPGGTSRWYFFEYGDTRVGYGGQEQFLNYGRQAVRRTVELVDMMFADGFSTVFVVVNTPEQDTRTSEYTRNLTWAYSTLADNVSLELYAKYKVGVHFRGAWAQALDRLEASSDTLDQFRAIEDKTAQWERWLIWLTHDSDPIPQSLVPLVSDSIQKTGQFPSRSALCQAYYGRPLEYADIFLSNNKLSVKHMCPPLVQLGDLYFTVNPSYYMDHRQWRYILYDHLFSRRRHYRDYKTLGPDVVDEMRSFYDENQGVTMGVGIYHASSQTWRPILSPSLQQELTHKT